MNAFAETLLPSLPDENSALLWYPPVAKAGLPVPRTELVPFDPNALWPLLDGQPLGDGFPLSAPRGLRTYRISGVLAH